MVVIMVHGAAVWCFHEAEGAHSGTAAVSERTAAGGVVRAPRACWEGAVWRREG